MNLLGSSLTGIILNGQASHCDLLYGPVPNFWHMTHGLYSSHLSGHVSKKERNEENTVHVQHRINVNTRRICSYYGADLARRTAVSRALLVAEALAHAALARAAIVAQFLKRSTNSIDLKYHV